MSDNTVFFHEEMIPENVSIAHYRKNIDSVPLHWHNYIEIEIIMGGSADHVMNGIESTIKKGHVSVLRINDYHSIKNSKDLDIFNLSIKDTFISESTLNTLNAVQTNLSFDLDSDTFNTIIFLCEAIIKENAYLNKSEKYMKNLLDCVFILLLRQESTSVKPIKKQYNDQLNAAVNYLHSHFRENPSLNTIAEFAHYSPTHFSHVFHKKIGRSYNDYLNDLKVSYAKLLLSTSNLKIIDAGYQSGFNSYNNFYSTFKHYTGLSPADYKKKKSITQTSGGHSWRFGLSETNIETNPAYVYIKTDVLEPETEYIFSYYYSYDYIIAFDRIQNSVTKQSIKIISQNTTELRDKKRTNRVEIFFKTKSKAPYCITLKMGKGLNNANCKHRYTALSDLTLLKANDTEAVLNPASEYTHANGAVTWSDNSEAYDPHIDAKGLKFD